MDGTGKTREETEKQTGDIYSDNDKKRSCLCLKDCKCANCKCHSAN